MTITGYMTSVEEATVGNIADASHDSVSVLGAFHTPTIDQPCRRVYYNSTDDIEVLLQLQDMVQKVGRSSANNEILGLQVVTSSVGNSCGYDTDRFHH